MSKIRLYGETSGYIELSAPDVADDNTVDLGLIPTVDTAASDGQFLAWNASLGKWEPTTMTTKEKRIARFTGSGTWTVPAGVTYAIAHMLGGGGGGGGQSTAGGTGGNSSVAFASGTVSAPGAANGNQSTYSNQHPRGVNAANSGRGGGSNSYQGGPNSIGADAQFVVAAASVTPAASITVTVGAGGTPASGARAGGSGYVYIEYYEEA